MIHTVLPCLVVAAASVAVEPPVNYEPNWESLETHQTPEWFEDAKFGIFIHWGVYSVPSFCDTSTYSEWYQHWLNTNSHGGKVTKFHAENYGEDFKYRDFAPMFRAEMWDPAEWASIFKRAGAEYIVITSKHHDGFCLWPSEVASEVRGYPWDSMRTGPKRDLLGELFEACREEGVRPGLYYSFMEWESPLYSKADKSEYVDRVMIPQIKDLIERYQPAVFWPDGEWDFPDTMWKSPEIVEWIYENAANPEEIVVNDRWGQGLRGQVGDYTTTEYDNLGNSSGKGMRKTRPFEECRGVGHSFAFNRAEGFDIYDSRTVCVQRLIDLVSRGGVLLLDIGPTADGRIPLIMVDRLLAIGDWLAVNGEAIKGTRRSPFRDLSWGRATVKGDNLYLHVFDWNDRAATATWTARLRPGTTYDVEMDFAVKEGAEGGRFELRGGEAVLEFGILEPTGGWNAFQRINVGQISIPSTMSASEVPITIRALSIPGEAAGNLRSMVLRPVSTTR
jgi:alpha-L-fucosidase